MIKTGRVATLILMVFWVSQPLRGQDGADLLTKFEAYPDMVVLNGKIVTMDNKTESPNPGTIVQAMAIRSGKILALGTTQEIQGLAGPKTTIINLQGRTSIPGLIDTHSHMFMYPEQAMSRELSPKVIYRTFQAKETLEATQQTFHSLLREAITATSAGEWIVITMQGGADWLFEGKFTNRKDMDALAPNNPVIVNSSAFSFINSQASKLVEAELPGYWEYIKRYRAIVGPYDPEPVGGNIGPSESQAIRWRVWWKKAPVSILAKHLVLEANSWARGGITTFSTGVYYPNAFGAYSYAYRNGLMPIRLAAHMELVRTPGPAVVVTQAPFYSGVINGVGDDWFWIDGFSMELWDTIYPGECFGSDMEMTAEHRNRQMCLVGASGNLKWEMVSNAMRAGWRITGIHNVGSDGARAFAQMVEQTSKEMGWTAEEVARMKFGVDHAYAIGKVPDVMEQFKKYGIRVNFNPVMYYNTGPLLIRDHVETVKKFLMPVKSYIDAGMRPTIHFEFPGAKESLFWALSIFINRRMDNGQVAMPEESIDRVQALKLATVWAAEYVDNENKIGSLEKGKLADFIVIDKDFFTIPEEEIGNIKNLMTVVGGKVVYKSPDM
ncbi:MAG: amidohydrolase family protein [Acidobacteria bacterium]|nr:amidohydrolase family protein [Acidobacteriota bacterium]